LACRGSMKRETFILSTLFCLLLVGFPFSGHTAGPDGFANVPWGATRSQVDQAMTQQGFRPEGQVAGKSYNDGSIGFSYQGAITGVTGHAQFWFLNDTFFRAAFSFSYNDDGNAEWPAYNRFLSIIQSKYGPPTNGGSMSPPYRGSYSVWDGLQAPGSSDVVQIALSYSATSERCGGNLCSSFFNVVYLNQGLQQRLAGQNRNGL